MGQHGGVAVGTKLVFAEFGDGVLRQAPYGGRDGVPETGADAEQLGAGFQNPVGVPRHRRPALPGRRRG